MKLPDELVGAWKLDRSGKVVGDEVEHQIQEALNRLTRIGHREGGWTTLYFDQSDNSFWELSYPNSGLHGGGPRKLTRVTAEMLSERYPNLDATELVR